MAAKLLNLIAFSSLALLACSFGPAPVNALSVDFSPNHARGLGHHNLLAKKKRAETRRCKPRPTTSTLVAVPSTTNKALPTSKAAPITSATSAKGTPAAKPTSTSTKKSTAQPSSTPISTTPTAGGGKAGLAWVNPASVPLKPFITQKTGAIYSWSPWKPAGADAAGLHFAPMLWGTKQTADFKRLVVPGYGNVALGFNEPDQSGQSDMSTESAVALWKQYIEPVKSMGYRLGAPAVTSGSSGKPWLQSFLKECTGCTIDIVPVHWYGTSAQQMIAYIQDFHSTFGKPIWVTEFACQNFSGGPQCTPSEITAFMQTVTEFMDNSPMVEMYFAFGFMTDMAGVNPENQLMGSNDQPTALGKLYLSG